MSFLQRNITAHDPLFRQRVEASVVHVAQLIQGEAQDTRTIAQWQKRAALAASVLNMYNYEGGTAVWLDVFANAAAANPVVGDVTPITETSPTDNDLEFAITSSWDDVAGVTGEDLL